MITSFWRYEIMFATVHVIGDNIRFCDGSGMLIRKAAYLSGSGFPHLPQGSASVDTQKIMFEPCIIV